MTSTPGCVVIDCGVDWLTVTGDNRRSAQLMVARAIRLMRQEEARGNQVGPWAMSGFSGFKCGSVQFGNRADEAIVRISSHVAHEAWRRFHDVASNCSRIDLQVTARYEVKPASVIASSYKQLRRRRKQLKRGAAISLFSSTDDSSTVYVGQRVSDRFGRIYDKAIESKRPEFDGCVRYEVEYKNETAARIFNHMAGQSESEAFIQQEVAGYFADKGHSPRWAKLEPASIRWPTKNSDRERQLRWLQKSVAVTVQNLVESGDGAHVLESLGLSISAGRLVVQESVTTRNYTQQEVA